MRIEEIQTQIGVSLMVASFALFAVLTYLLDG